MIVRDAVEWRQLQDSEGGYANRAKNRPPTRSVDRAPRANELPGRKFPVRRAIQKLSDDLDALNERIAELENEGHRGHAMDVLKANASDFARWIDELKSLLVAVPTKKNPLNRADHHA